MNSLLTIAELKNDSKAKADQHEKEAIQRKSELAEAKQCLATFQHQINALREEKTKVESNLIDTKAELEEKSRLLAAEHNELVALRITNEQSIVYLEVKTADLRALESQIECIISGYVWFTIYLIEVLKMADWIQCLNLRQRERYPFLSPNSQCQMHQRCMISWNQLNYFY